MTHVRLHQLEGFYYVAREGSYTRAAQAFPYPIGQPAVYQQVKGLQEDLGLCLVRQAGSRRTELTPEGRALFAHIAPFFESFPRLCEQLANRCAQQLTIVSDQFLASEALPPAIVQLRKEHPELHLRIEECSSPEAAEILQSGRVDLGVLALTEVPRGFAWEGLGRIGIALLIPQHHPLNEIEQPAPHEIAHHPLIVYAPNTDGRLLTERIFKKLGQRLRVAIEVSFARTMHALVRAGIAPAFVPFLKTGKKTSVRNLLPSIEGTRSVDLSELAPAKLEFGLLYRPGMEESLAFQALRRQLYRVWTGK